MLTNFARTQAQELLNAVARVLHRLGFTPNVLTVIGFGLVCLVAVVIAAGHEALGGILLVFAVAFDATDGSVARLTNSISKFGGFLDSSLDRYADGVLLLALVWRGIEYENRWIVVLAVVALIGGFLVSYTRARAEAAGVAMKDGWFTRLERMILLVLGLLATAVIGQTGLMIMLALLAVLSNFTAIQRIWLTRGKLES